MVAGRSITRTFQAVAVVALVAAVAAADNPRTLHVGITPVLIEDHLDQNRQLVAYIGERLGTPAVLVQRHSYKEISDLLEHAQVDVAFICGLTYVVDHERFGLELLAAPVEHDDPVYFAYVIVPADSAVGSFAQLRGKRFAFSDPLSNSGWLVPVHDLASMSTTPEAFFKRTIFTYSHAESVEAVAVKFVDGASVDSYVYDHLAALRPALVARTRIIARSVAHPAPPVVVRAGLDPEVKRRLKALLLEMSEDPRGRVILDGMRIKRFVAASDESFDGLREMRRLVTEQYAGSPPRRGIVAP